MRREVSIMATRVVVWFLLVGPVGVPAHEPAPPRVRVWIHGCYDGDTCTVSVPGWPAVVGEKIPVRIVGIDAPERKGKCAKETELATEARRFLEERLTKLRLDPGNPQSVSLPRVELSEVRRDKYFRLLARVWADGVEVGPLLIARGLARPYGGGTRRGWCEGG